MYNQLPRTSFLVPQLAIHDTPMHRVAKTSYIILTWLAAVVSPTEAQQPKRALTFNDFAAVRLVSDPQLSPDGRSVLYALRTTDVEANRRLTHTIDRKSTRLNSSHGYISYA